MTGATHQLRAGAVYRIPEASEPRLLYDLSFGLLAMSGVPTALALGSYAALAFRSAQLPTATAWLAAIAALAHLMLLASLGPRLLLTRGRGDDRDSRHALCLDPRHELGDAGLRATRLKHRNQQDL
jgi:hypothetical protein